MDATITLTPYQFEIVRLLAERAGITPAEVLLGFFGCNAPRVAPVSNQVQCTAWRAAQ